MIATDATRILCQKYTDLTDEEISCIESYNKLLPALANAEQADVFIDCKTSTGRSAIVVSEAKPQTVPSNYSIVIQGSLIQWHDEPAVDRSFRLGVPTVGVRAVSMPENRRVVQTVEPLFFQEKLIAVLIYEKPSVAEVIPEESEPIEESRDMDWAAVAPYLEDAVLFFDDIGRVCGYNRKAESLYRNLGYIGELMGMSSTNLQPAAVTDCEGKAHRAVMANRTLEYQKIAIFSGKACSALILRDVTEEQKLKEELSFQKIALREQRHRMKNNLQMIANLTRGRGYEISDLETAQMTLIDTANRLLSITTALDGMVQVSGERVSLLQVLEQIRTYTLQTLLTPAKDVSIRVRGKDLKVSVNSATSIALVVNELVQNALKHAFPAGARGTVEIELRNEGALGKISVTDNGVGVQKTASHPGSSGLELASSIVREKLIGEWNFESSELGTRVTFDFLEK